MVRRRAVLGGIGVGITGVLAGCTGLGDDSGSGGDEDSGDTSFNDDTATPTDRPDADNDGSSDRQDDYPNDASYDTKVYNFSDRPRVREDEYFSWDLQFSEDTDIGYDMVVRSGPNIDVFLIPESEWKPFQDGERFRYDSEASELDTANAQSGGVTISSGTYYFVLDNSNRATDPPSNMDEDIAEIELQVIAAR